MPSSAEKSFEADIEAMVNEARLQIMQNPEQGPAPTQVIPVSRDERGQERIGDWVQTYGGRSFWPLDPRPTDIFITDIAHALSLLCRFGGHCCVFYSVAEHCVLMSRQCADPYDKLWCLLHDASEAYIGDMVRPLKRMIPQFQDIEHKIDRIIFQRFGLFGNIPTHIKTLDNRMLMTEAEVIMLAPPKTWAVKAEVLEHVSLKFWSPEIAKEQYLEEFRSAFLHYNTGEVF